MLKYLVIIGLLVGTIPFWLPSPLGGDTSYHFVLTDSMRGTLDPGAFVILRRSDSYEVGDAVGYWQELAGGERATILHRIVGRLPDGKYVLKGDAVTSTEEVEEAAITGRMVFAVPALGFLPGAFRQAPLLLGGLLLAVVLLTGGVKKAVDSQTKSQLTKPTSNKEEGKQADAEELNVFLPVSLILLLALPFATGSVADLIPNLSFLAVVETLTEKLPLFVLLLAVVGVTRFGEVLWSHGPQRSSVSSIVGLNYGIVMLMAVTIIPFAEMLQSAKEVLAF